MAFADFQALYKQKLTTADEAVKVIKSGDWVDYGFGAGFPELLVLACGSRRSSTSRTRCTISSSTLTT